MEYFFYKLIPPRPTFPADMTEAEGAAMEQHFAYWQELIDQGRVVVYGPVGDPEGTFGMAVIEADRIDEVDEVGRNDPAVGAGASTYAVFPMPATIVRS